MSAVIRRSQNDFLKDCLARLRHLHVEIVVADKPKENTVAIRAIVSHHLLHNNLTSAGALVDDVLYKVRIASHITSSLPIGLGSII